MAVDTTEGIKFITDCLRPSGWTLGPLIAKTGGQGIIYVACNKQGCDTSIVKIIDTRIAIGAYERELVMSELVNTTTAAPQVAPLRTSPPFKCGALGFVFMARYDGDMDALGYNQSSELLQAIGFSKNESPVLLYTERQLLDMFGLAQALSETYTIHGDLNPVQILERKRGKELVITDYGSAGSELAPVPFKQAELGWFPSLSKYSSSKYSVPIPTEFWPYFNSYQLLLSLLPLYSTDNPFITLVALEGGKQVQWLTATETFASLGIPPNDFKTYNQWLFGMPELPALPQTTSDRIAQTIKALEKSLGPLQPYRFPYARNPPKKRDPTFVATPIPAPVKRDPTFVVAPVALAPVACELEGYKVMKVLVKGKYEYAVTTSTESGKPKRFIFRRQIGLLRNGKPRKWKPRALYRIPRSLLALVK